MSELFEFATVAEESTVKCKWLECALSFEVKAAANVIVGLTRKSTRHSSYCEVWVVIGQEKESCLWIQGRCYAKARTLNILSDSEYRKFWMTWHNNVIKFGKDGETTPLLYGRYEPFTSGYISFGLNEAVLCGDYLSHRSGYISFGLAGGENRPAYWKLEMPPQQIFIQPIFKSVKGGKPEWVNVEKQLPEDAIVGGCEKDPLYIIRAPHCGSLTPGKFVPSEGVGYIPWGGQAHEKRDFVEVLRGYDCVWMKTNSDIIPDGAIEGGHSEHTHEILYVGRAMHEGYLIPGKVQPSHKLCYIAYIDREIGKHYYEILVSRALVA